MKLKQRIGIVGLCLCLTGLSAMAAERIPYLHSAKDVSLELRPDSTEILVHEPLRLTMILTNASIRDLNVSWSTLRTTPILGSFDGEPMARWDSVVYNVSPWEGIICRAKESLTSDRVILLLPTTQRTAGRVCVFDRPGKYKVKAALNFGDGASESPTVDVTVRACPREWEGAAALVADVTVADVLQEHALTADGVEKLKRLVQDYPNSPYANQSLFELGLAMGQSDGASRGTKEASIGLGYFARIPAEAGALRVRAAIEIGTILCMYDGLRTPTNLSVVVGELERLMPIAERMGVAKRAQSTLLGLKSLPAPTARP